MRVYTLLAQDVPDWFKRQHRATWYVYAGDEKIRYDAKNMRGVWGFDVVCACGYESKTGGAIKPEVKDYHSRHIWDEYGKLEG